MGYQSQKLISTHTGNNKTQMFLESKYIRTANIDALTVVVGFKQRHTQKPLRGRGGEGHPWDAEPSPVQALGPSCSRSNNIYRKAG